MHIFKLYFFEQTRSLLGHLRKLNCNNSAPPHFHHIAWWCICTHDQKMKRDDNSIFKLHRLPRIQESSLSVITADAVRLSSAETLGRFGQKRDSCLICDIQCALQQAKAICGFTGGYRKHFILGKKCKMTASSDTIGRSRLSYVNK